MAKTKRRFTVRQKSAATVAFLVALSLGSATLISGHAARAWAQTTQRQPERYTALSFVDTGNLPTYTPAGMPKTVAFRLANNLSVGTTYRYRVFVHASSHSTLISQGELALEDGAFVDTTFTYTLPLPDMDATITVQLLDHPEYITFGTKS